MSSQRRGESTAFLNVISYTMAKKQNMRLVCVALAVVLALFLLYVFFSMSKESFNSRTCKEDEAKLRDTLRNARGDLLKEYKKKCYVHINKNGCEDNYNGTNVCKDDDDNRQQIKQAIRKINRVLGKDEGYLLDDIFWNKNEQI